MLKIRYTLRVCVSEHLSEDGVVGYAKLSSVVSVCDVQNLNAVCEDRQTMGL